MILQQYPHLKAAGLAAPPHMLGRNPATEHMHMLQAREREVQMERERQSRERREAEQRERDRQEKERMEKERLQREHRERQERERQERERQLSAVEAVDHHFQLSMELAKKVSSSPKICRYLSEKILKVHSFCKQFCTRILFS